MTMLRVCKAEASKQEKRKMKFRKPHWPPVISAEESERRRFQESLEDRSQATPSTSKQWPPIMKTVKVSAVTDADLKRVPRATAWRRRKRAKEDKALKHAEPQRRDPKGYPCRLCGKPKRLEFGHSFYRGKHFCATAAGRSVSEWLNRRDVPRTTAWRRKREEALAEGLSEKVKKNTRYSPAACASSQRQGEWTHGRTVELWLAEQRALAPVE